MAKKKGAWIREDGWQNIFTNLGVEGKDPRTGMRTNPLFLSQTEAENFYQADDIAQKVIDRLPEEMTREGFTVKTPEEDFTKQIEDFFTLHELEAKIEKCLKMARLYGGSALLFGIDDGQMPNMPVNWNKVGKISFIQPLSRYDFQSVSSLDLDKDVSSPNFNEPKFYQLSTELKSGQPVSNNPLWNGKIHYTRIVRFKGAEVYGKHRDKTSYWGDSILSRLWWPIANYVSAYDSAALIMRDVVKIIVKLKDLHSMIAMGKDELVTKRLQLLSKTASIVNAIVVEEGEEVESKTTTLTGIPELLQRLDKRLVAATDLPHTILLGEGATGGIGNKGESEKRDWYDHVKNKQESILRPIIEKILKFYFSSEESPTQKKYPEGLTISFKPLWLPSTKETAETRKIVAETDKIYYEIGVLDEDEIAESRWGSGEYSIETTIDMDAREALEEESEEEDMNEEEPLENEEA